MYAPGAVIDADVTVRVNGVVREHVSMSWSGDTTGGLPDQVVSAGTGMRSRTGKITWAQEDPVQVEPPHPLRQASGWPPREGDELVIDSTVDTGQGPYTFRRFTGRLGRTTGSLVDGTLSSEITDTLSDHLNTLVSVPPLLRQDYGPVSSWTVAYRALEQSRLGHLPPPDGDVIAHFTGQGESAPVSGTLSETAPSFTDPEAGMWVRSSRLNLSSDRPRAGRDILLVARGSRRYDSWAQIILDDYSTIRVTVALSGAMTVIRSGSTIWSGQWDDYSTEIPVLAIQVGTSGQARVWTSRTRYTTISLAVASARTVHQTLADHVSGVSVRYLSSASAGPSVVASAPPRPLQWAWTQVAMEPRRITRGVENVMADSVVDQWSEATLTSFWMDETGTPIAMPREMLVAGAPSRTQVVQERVFDGAWSRGDDSLRSQVVVKVQEGFVQESRPGLPREVVYAERSVRTFDTPEVVERFIEADSEMEWGPIDLSVSRWTGASSVSGDLPAYGTWAHAVVSYGPDDDDRWAWEAVPSPSTYTVTVERLGQRTLKVTETVVPGSGVAAVYLKSPSPKSNQSTAWIKTSFRDVASPVIRADWVSQWRDLMVIGATQGPSWAPTMVHDAGWWLTTEGAQVVADALAKEVATSMPTLSGVSLLWDPTRQIGDVEDWIAAGDDGSELWVARVLIVGYSEQWDGTVPTQSVDVRVISWIDPLSGKTYADLAAAYDSYSGMSPGTYQQVLDALPDTI